MGDLISNPFYQTGKVYTILSEKFTCSRSHNSKSQLVSKDSKLGMSDLRAGFFHDTCCLWMPPRRKGPKREVWTPGRPTHCPPSTGCIRLLSLQEGRNREWVENVDSPGEPSSSPVLLGSHDEGQQKTHVTRDSEMLTALSLPKVRKWFISAVPILKHISTLAKFMEPMNGTQTRWPSQHQQLTQTSASLLCPFLPLILPSSLLPSTFLLCIHCSVLEGDPDYCLTWGTRIARDYPQRPAKDLFIKSCPADEIIQNQSWSIKHQTTVTSSMGPSPTTSLTSTIGIHQ